MGTGVMPSSQRGPGAIVLASVNTAAAIEKSGVKRCRWRSRGAAEAVKGPHFAYSVPVTRLFPNGRMALASRLVKCNLP